MDGFEGLDVWKQSSRLCVELYRELKDSREWGFRDQITRSALSVPSNIAEGYERSSRREYVQFLRIAKGSCGEMRTQLYIGQGSGADRIIPRPRHDRGSNRNRAHARRHDRKTQPGPDIASLVSRPSYLDSWGIV